MKYETIQGGAFGGSDGTQDRTAERSPGPLLLFSLLFRRLVFRLRSVVRLALLFGLRLLLVLLTLVPVGRLGGMRSILAVIGHVPAGALELHRGSRDDLLHRAPARR